MSDPYYDFAAGTPVETGFIGAIADAVGGIADIAAGGPQKRERTAKAELAAEQLRYDQAALAVQANDAAARGAAAKAQGDALVALASMGSGGGSAGAVLSPVPYAPIPFMSRKMWGLPAPVVVGGLVLAVGALAVYMVRR